MGAEELTLAPGKERWAVKTGTDPQASEVKLDAPVKTQIAFLASCTPPSDPDSLPDRLAPIEDTVYQVDATLVAYKEEADGDFHLVISDGQNTMIAEIPDPDFCDGSVWLDQIKSTRAAFDGKFGKELTSLRRLTYTLTDGVAMVSKISVPVSLTGVGFFDKLHGQTGVAPNGIELHPVLSITFPDANR